MVSSDAIVPGFFNITGLSASLVAAEYRCRSFAADAHAGPNDAAHPA